MEKSMMRIRYKKFLNLSLINLASNQKIEPHKSYEISKESLSELKKMKAEMYWFSLISILDRHEIL